MVREDYDHTMCGYRRFRILDGRQRRLERVDGFEGEEWVGQRKGHEPEGGRCVRGDGLCLLGDGPQSTRGQR